MTELASATTTYRIGWSDTDASRRVYYGAMFRLFDMAEVELWRSLDALELYDELPRVHAEADYRRSLYFDDEIVVEARLEGVGRTSVEVGFTITKDDEVACTGRVVAVRVQDGNPMPIRDRLPGFDT